MSPTPEQIEIILKVVDRIAQKYTFGYYDVDDIKQESYIICCEALEKYDESRPFENFISKHLSNRLKTFIRDNYFRSSTQSAKHADLNDRKKRLVDLKSFDFYNTSYEDAVFEKISTAEALEIVMSRLPPSMRNNFYKLANGVCISSAKKQALISKIKEILGEDW